jgi:lipopolysaccharide transport system ATP-binding protein
MSVILAVEAVSKQFRLQHNRPATLKEAVVRRLTGQRAAAREHWALREVTFQVERGRALGILGHNGAGKSTLLRLLCGLGRPTTGRIQVAGPISGLLDLGSGFHPDMTGRENILTGGLLVGLTRREVLAQQDEIIAFAELEEFIDQPVRTYSSGMYLRLAFATAVQFDPDILVIDEVLAVGDARFQQKCLKRMEAFRAAGKTLILTSHVFDQLRALCDEVLVLEEGRVVLQSDPESAIRYYEDLMRQRTERRAAQLAGHVPLAASAAGQHSRLGTQEATITAVTLYDIHGVPTEHIRSGEGLYIDLAYALAKPIPDLIVSLAIFNTAHVKCFETIIPSLGSTLGPPTAQGRLRCYFPELPLFPGRYYVNAGLYPLDWSYIYDYHWQMHAFDVSDGGHARPHASGIVALHPVWTLPDHRS